MKIESSTPISVKPPTTFKLELDEAEMVAVNRILWQSKDKDSPDLYDATSDALRDAGVDEGKKGQCGYVAEF